MSIPFKKYGYKLNPITDEIEYPQIFLVNKRLKKMGELYPVENFQITINEVNQADEISFTYYKDTNNEERPLFEQIDDLTVVQVQDYGFFELAVNKQQSDSIKKTVSGISLGIAELSQIAESLEINTDDDIDREDYDINFPTVFYREITIGDTEDLIKKKTESSLLHRILKRAPHYKIGYVSPTLKYVQRTFSWSDANIISIFNDISEEINCVFDVRVGINEDGKVERIVNAYDMQYCEYCWDQLTIEQKNANNVHQFRNIVNGVCQNCGQSDHVRDIGDDTNIFISVDNLSDEITVDSDKDSIKNCFKIIGGDDYITDTVKGLSMSGSNRIFMFSDYQKKLMSNELVEVYEKYVTECNDSKDAYTKLLETQYNLYDVIAYLQSGKMPLLEEEIITLDMALYKTIEQIQTYYKGKCYVTQWSYYNTSMMTAYNAVKNLFTTFLPKGYQMTIDEDDKIITDEYDPNVDYKWIGKIKFYRTTNSDDYYVLHLENASTYITHGKDSIFYFDDQLKQSVVDNFKLLFYFGDKSQTEYMEYIKQHCAYILSKVDLTYDNEKARHWEDYGLNLLNNYHDGFTSCIESIDTVIAEEKFEDLAIKELKKIKSTYQKIQSDINKQIYKLEQQIFALCYYLGDFSMAQSYVDSSGTINSVYQQYISSVSTTLSHMVDSRYKGGYEKDINGNISVNNYYTVNEYIGDKPIKCKRCGSTNVSLTTNGSVCNNCNSTDIYTYVDMMQDIVDEYNRTKGQIVTELQRKYRENLNMESYINKYDTKNLGLYNELCSFIREDVYSNSNFVSDGLTNAEVVAQTRELITKAEQELAKACIQNYTITAPLSAIVAQKEFEYNGVIVNDDYSDFKINNYVRVKIDDDVFKVRISSIEIPFPIEDKITVTFTNVTKSNGTMNTVAEAVKNATSMATSYNYVATQAEKGQQANETFQTIKNEGLNAGLMSVKGGSEEQDVIVDNHGILLRRKIFETSEYSPYQMKLINRNIVMTDDNWNTAKMAIGYGMYEGSPYYGVWCDLLVGDLLCGNKLKIIGGGDGTNNATVIIDGDGITLDGGAIKWINKGVADKVTIYYAVSSSSTIHPEEDSSDWKETFTGTLNDNYLWSKTVRIDTANKKTVSYNCLGNSPDGVKLTKKQYYLSTSNSSTVGGSWLDYQPTWKGSGYVWTRTYIEYISGASKAINVIYDSGLTASLKDFSGFKDKVTNTLTAGSSKTEIGSDYVITPKIGGGYLYIASGNYSVEIDPNHGSSDTESGYLFCIRNKSTNNKIMSVNTDGDAYFRGKIVTESGSQITLDGDTVVSSGFSLRTERLYGASLIIGGENLGNHGILQLQDYNNNTGATINGNGIATFKSVSASKEVSTGRLAFDYTDKSCLFKSEATFSSGIVLSNSTAGNGIKTSGGYNIIRGNNSADVYIGGGYANNIWLDATNIYYTDKAPAASGSDKRIKHDISTLDKTHEDFILSLNPCSYKFNDGTSNRIHWGFIADELENSMFSTTGDSGVFVKMPKDCDTDVDLDDPSTYVCGIRYSELIAPMVKTIQTLSNQIDILKQEIQLLKGQ